MESDIRQFVASYLLNSLPIIKVKAFNYQSGSEGSALPYENVPTVKTSGDAFLQRSSVDSEIKVFDGKYDDIAHVVSDDSDDSQEEVQIGSEQHNFKSPAPRPLGSRFSQDITVDLMRFRSSAVVPFQKKSIHGKQTTIVLDAKMRVADSRKMKRALRPDREQTPTATLTHASTPRPVSKRRPEVAIVHSSAKGEKYKLSCKKRLMDLVLESWKEAHAASMLQKKKILDQYFACCAYMKRSPFLTTQLRRLLIKPSASHLDLSACGMTGRDITALLCALSGRGCDLNIDKVLCIQDVCNGLGDSCLASIDLRGNNLGAAGATALTSALLNAHFFRLERSLPSRNGVELIAGLTELDLSGNALGLAGATPIESLLIAPKCTLKKLILCSNMLCDQGCAVVVRALSQNSSLEFLKLTANAAENAAGQAIGSMLEKNSVLQHLILSYNHLRGNGAKRLGHGLAKNKTLKTLDVQWNGFGDADTISELARALPLCGVEELNLAHNRIKLKGASIISSSLELGTKIRELSLDGTLIGQIGARAVYRAVQEGQEKQEFPTSVSLVDCGTHIVDKNAFDPCEPAGSYKLDLNSAYDRLVLFKLMRVAMSKNGSFVSIKSNGTTAQFNATVGKESVRISDNSSIDVVDWSICTAQGIDLPLVEEVDDHGSVPLSKTWAKLLDRREESDTCVIRFAFSNNRKRARLSDCLQKGYYDFLAKTFSDPEISGDRCVEAIDTIFGSDTFISAEQMESLLKILCDEQDPARHTELSNARVIFVTRCFHKLVPLHSNSQMLDRMTSMEERRALAKALGSVSIQ